MVNLPLDKMTVEEKLQVMEEIWDDLSGRAESVPSPLWHGEVLAEREQTVERGEAVSEEWEAAKSKIRDKAFASPGTFTPREAPGDAVGIDV